ncbi:hypothetical protein ILYODFUR_004907 [Ilyodon furcidens]|uniref:Uncharacterized protein n=1 Tax=Ilyodon furcidens TaxID=33524 RepID=A0ABV0VBT5_9TELE
MHERQLEDVSPAFTATLLYSLVPNTLGIIYSFIWSCAPQTHATLTFPSSAFNLAHRCSLHKQHIHIGSRNTELGLENYNTNCRQEKRRVFSCKWKRQRRRK